MNSMFLHCTKCDFFFNCEGSYEKKREFFPVGLRGKPPATANFTLWGVRGGKWIVHANCQLFSNS